MSGDIAVRLGIILLVSIRFARLSLILDPPKRKFLIPCLLLVFVPMITSLAMGIDFRLKESAYFQAYPNAIGRPLWLDNIRKQESLVAFVSAFLAMSVNIGTDVVFFTIIKSRLRLQSTPRAQGKGLPGVAAYAVAIAAKVVYLVLMTWAQVITGGPLNLPVRSMAITLSRFSPTVETYVFFTRTIPTSRNLLQSRKLAASSEAVDQTINQTILVTTTMDTGGSPPSQVGTPLHDVSATVSSTSAADASVDAARAPIGRAQHELWFEPEEP
ncbi:hypothetical protein BCR44DRAFT_1428717 [Catenaria anguillulae PL171]|uniref:Uncharacterized protein n=1 Tax=Catenaria anguillulae PL171 TaxID=765915 RepID=A0A1Y2HVN5_9FUNG|nr:hypothetical protein BCR44DRAFT_1428717 [Catenaria anguillulae PL171]